MSSQRNTGAFIAGGVIGGLVGAAVTLWKTPQSGHELREKFAAERPAGVTYRPGESGQITEEQRFSNPILSFVEKATAPIVGVDLGKLAKDDPETSTTAPVRTSSADAKPPTLSSSATVTRTVEPKSVEPPVIDEPVTRTAEPSVVDETVTRTGETTPAEGPVDEDVQSPEEAATHDDDEGSHAHAATVDELTSPPPGYVEERNRPKSGTNTNEDESPFPDLPSASDTRDTR